MPGGNRIGIGELNFVSPSLAGLLQSCMLRAGIPRIPEIINFVIGNPKAWLGTAYHYVLENYSNQVSSQGGSTELIEALWNKAIEHQYQRMINHPLDSRYSDPKTWPGYYLIFESLKRRIRNITEYNWGNPLGAIKDRSNSVMSQLILHERDLSAFNGKLKGRPDLVIGKKIIDYKSGNIYEHDNDGDTVLVKEAYVQQLKIYAYLINENMGYWPEKGVILPISGPGIDIDLIPRECTDEAIQAVRLLDNFNNLVHSQSEPWQISSPNPEICKWCPYKMVCLAFWQEISPDWLDDSGILAIEGILNDAPRQVFNGAASSLSIDVLSGSLLDSNITISPLNPSWFQNLNNMKKGDIIRVTGLQKRKDGSLLPTLQTSIFLDHQLPVLFISPLERKLIA